MEHKLDELLKQLHRYLFADSEQVIVELRHYMLDRSLKEAELGKLVKNKFITNDHNKTLLSSVHIFEAKYLLLISNNDCAFNSDLLSFIAFVSSKVFNSNESLL